MTAESLLPFLPLTKGGKSHDNIDYMITELVARNCSDLLMLGYYFASLVFTDEEDKQWLIERFSKVQDIVESSWVYQANIQKGFEEGLEKGREEGLQQAAISIVKAHFPELEKLAKDVITMISDLNRLQVLVVELSTASSQEDARELLCSFVSDA